MKKLLVAIMFSSSMLVNTACTEQEVAFSSGLVVGVIGGIAIGDDHDHRRPRNRCESRRVCNTYVDYWGRRRQECRVKQVCRRGGHYALNVIDGDVAMSGDTYLVSSEFQLASSNSQDMFTSAEVAQAFALSFDGADKLMSGLTKAQKGDINQLKALGLSQSDAQRLSNKRLPSQNGIKSLGKSLNQDPKMTKNMLQKIVSKL